MSMTCPTATWLLVGLLALGYTALAQTPTDPFPTPIPATEGVIRVRFVEFASIPDIEGEAARMMLLVDEPGTRRMFVNDMRGPLYTVSYDGQTVTPYLDINAPKWGVSVQSIGRERGFQSFAVHPQFGQAGTPGFGKFYTWTDTHEHHADARLRAGRRQPHARHGPARMDGQESRAPPPTTAGRRAR